MSGVVKVAIARAMGRGRGRIRRRMKPVQVKAGCRPAVSVFGVRIRPTCLNACLDPKILNCVTIIGLIIAFSFSEHKSVG